ncbi:MAG TPA: hypothetical protein VF411_01650 [Bacteroidia bacterium]
MNPTIDLIKIKSELLLKNNNMQTMTENEVLSLLSNELPELEVEIKKTSKQVSIYIVISCFVNITKHMAKIGNVKEVKHCFNLAEKMLQEGNNTVKNAIENVYVYSLGTYLYSLGAIVDLSASTATQLRDIFSGSLRKEYYRQVYGSGI